MEIALVKVYTCLLSLLLILTGCINKRQEYEKFIRDITITNNDSTFWVCLVKNDTTFIYNIDIATQKIFLLKKGTTPTYYTNPIHTSSGKVLFTTIIKNDSFYHSKLSLINSNGSNETALYTFPSLPASCKLLMPYDFKFVRLVSVFVANV